MLKSQNIFLRKLQKTDVEVILKWENNTENWQVSGITTPFSREDIAAFVSAEHDLKKNKQIRYVICLNSSKIPIGTIDFFEYDKQLNSVGIGVLIAESKDRKKGYAKEALLLMLEKCKNELSVVTIFCNIIKDNRPSIRLFEGCGFQFVEERILFEEKVNYYEKVI